MDVLFRQPRGKDNKEEKEIKLEKWYKEWMSLEGEQRGDIKSDCH